MMKSTFYIFYLFFLLSAQYNIFSNDNIVILPLISKNLTYFTNLKNITHIMEYIYLDTPIAELYIGSPPQKSNIIVKTDDSNIYFTSFNHIASENDETYTLKYPNINYFNEEKSNSIEINETKNTSYFINNFDQWKIVYDNFRINNNSSNEIQLNFVVANSIKVEEPGSLGLQIKEDLSFLQLSQSFLIQLKLNQKINNYKWFIYYGENNKDYLVIGCSPHEFYVPGSNQKLFPNINLETEFHNINDQIILNRPTMQIKFNDIYITSNLTSLEKDEDFKDIEYFKNGYFKIYLGAIVGPNSYENYLKNIFFKDYLNENKCHMGTFNQIENLSKLTFKYYYCEASLYNNIKKDFKSLIFKHVDLNENFILSFNDLFIKNDNYLIFLVIFHIYNYYYWDLGTPFLRKYQFVFDFDNKQVGYYYDKFRKENNGNEGDGEKVKNDNKKLRSYLGYISLILILSGLLIYLGFMLGKKVYNIRKKRANELDDDYEYKEDKKNEVINENE